jgi:hypothetical protein
MINLNNILYVPAIGFRVSAVFIHFLISSMMEMRGEFSEKHAQTSSAAQVAQSARMVLPLMYRGFSFLV